MGTSRDEIGEKSRLKGQLSELFELGTTACDHTRRRIAFFTPWIFWSSFLHTDYDLDVLGLVGFGRATPTRWWC